MKSLLVAAALVLSFASHASEFKTTKCFTRTYSDLHMVKNPTQLARSVKFAFVEDKNKNSYGIVSVALFDGDANTIISAIASCQKKIGNKRSCYADSDRGSYSVTESGKFAVLSITDFLALDGVDGDNNPEVTIIKAGSANGIYNLNVAKLSDCKDIGNF